MQTAYAYVAVGCTIVCSCLLFIQAPKLQSARVAVWSFAQRDKSHTAPRICTPAQQMRMNAAAAWSSGRFLTDAGRNCTWMPYIKGACMQKPTCNLSSLNLPGPRNILLYGDSVDRHLIDAACRLLNTTSIDWAAGIVKYKSGVSPSGLCSTKSANISFLQLYGAPKAGPYLHGHVNDANDPFTDTPLRIRKTMQHYASVTGAVPDMVVYQTNLWDAYGKGFDASLKQYNKSLDMLDRYYHNTLYNLDLIQSLLPAHTPIIMRTTPGPQNTPFPLLFEFNNVIRRAAVCHCLPCLDWSAMTSYVGKENIFRDALHPSKEQS